MGFKAMAVTSMYDKYMVRHADALDDIASYAHAFLTNDITELIDFIFKILVVSYI